MFWVVEFGTPLVWAGPVLTARPFKTKRRAEWFEMTLRVAGRSGAVMRDFDAPYLEGDFSEQPLRSQAPQTNITFQYVCLSFIIYIYIYILLNYTLYPYD